jgi:hypothetical protein
MENVGVIGAKGTHPRKLSEIPARLRVGKQGDARAAHHPFAGTTGAGAGAAVAIAASSGAANRGREIDMLLQTVRFQRKPDASPSWEG